VKSDSGGDENEVSISSPLLTESIIELELGRSTTIVVSVVFDKSVSTESSPSADECEVPLGVEEGMLSLA
jgi:hypothetical protein